MCETITLGITLGILGGCVILATLSLKKIAEELSHINHTFGRIEYVLIQMLKRMPECE